MDDVVLRTEALTKFYGRDRGIIDVDVEIRRGEVFGFLGPNGAGKTTTIRLLLDLIRPTRGRAVLFGLDSHRDSLAIRRRVGYLPGELRLYDSLSGRELLGYFGHLRGRPAGGFATELAERLDCDLSREIKRLSHGNRQKLGLIQALMSRPEFLILDEPTLGLDPLIQHEFFRLLDEARAAGQSVFLSSHNLSEIERACDRVGIIREGRLLAVERVAALKARALRRLEIQFGGDVDETAFQTVPGIRQVTVEDGLLRCEVVGSLDALMKAASRFEIVNVTSREPSLEEIFLAFYGPEAGRVA